MNKIIVTGRLAKAPELRYTQNNAVCSIVVAVARPYNKDAEKQEADFFNGVIWGVQAENTAKHCPKGGRVAIEGRLQTRSYDGKDGQKKYITEIIVSKIEFYDFIKSPDEKAEAPAAPGNFEQLGQTVPPDQEVPF